MCVTSRRTHSPTMWGMPGQTARTSQGQATSRRKRSVCSIFKSKSEAQWVSASRARSGRCAKWSLGPVGCLKLKTALPTRGGTAHVMGRTERTRWHHYLFLITKCRQVIDTSKPVQPLDNNLSQSLIRVLVTYLNLPLFGQLVIKCRNELWIFFASNFAHLTVKSIR